jgi:hypothetical protein
LKGTESAIFKDLDISSIGSTKKMAAQLKRSFWEKVSEFNDPQRVLGAGISSYHQQLVHLFFLILLLFLLHIPLVCLFNSFGFYDDSILQMFTLGNLGFSETHC